MAEVKHPIDLGAGNHLLTITGARQPIGALHTVELKAEDGTDLEFPLKGPLAFTFAYQVAAPIGLSRLAGVRVMCTIAEAESRKSGKTLYVAGWKRVTS